MDYEALQVVAAQHAGAFSTAHALHAGWTERQVRRARDTKAWHRLYEGAFVDAELWHSMDSRARALCQLRGRLLVVGQGWHAARRSALLVHGLPFLGQPPADPQLVRARRRTSDRAATAHERIAALPAADRAQVGGCQVTALARTVVDEARESSFVAGLVVADAALRIGLSRPALESVAAQHLRSPGAQRMRQVVAWASGLSESPFESLSRGKFVELGLPVPEQQVEIWAAGQFVARVDFLWREQNLIGEADGKSKYDSVDTFYAEKLREQALEDLGFEVVRWDWDMAWSREHELAAAVRRGLSRGGLNALAPGVRLVTPTRDRLAA